jgi:GTP-binding protein EngB required for normal cell division
VTAAGMPGGGSSDGSGHGAGRERDTADGPAWPEFLSPEYVPTGLRDVERPRQADRPAAGEDWPAAGEAGDAGLAQVFHPGPGRRAMPGEAEPGLRPGSEAPLTPASPPVPPVPLVSRHAWDDGLIARRAPDSGTVTGSAALQHPADGSEPAPGPFTAPRPAGEHGEPPRMAPAPPAEHAEHAEHVQGSDTGPPPGEAPEAPAPQAQDARDPDDPPCPDSARTVPTPTGLGGGVVAAALRRRLSAMNELIGLSRTRLDGKVLAEAGRVLDEAGARAQLSGAYTTVAIAGATVSGKSSLLNALAGRTLSETGLRRPTTAQPVACTWEAEREGGADGLLDRLGIAPPLRRRVKDPALHGLVLIDLPDHDSVEPGHREHVDRLLKLVDAVVWVVDPEKYADALLHERYLRPLAGYAEVSFVVLNQIDRLPGEATDAVLHDLRRLLDEDGMALGDYGEPGARVLATSALTGEGLPELREELGALAATREAPVRRLTADLDGAAERLRRVYADPSLPTPAGLTEADREEFEDLLATAVGACAAGQAAERAWLRYAERSCGTPWSQLVRWRDARKRSDGGRLEDDVVPQAPPGEAGPRHEDVLVARPVLTQAVRQIADRAAVGLPDAWRRTVRDAAWRGAEGLPEALDTLIGRAAAGTDHHAGGTGPGTAPVDAADRALDIARMPRPPWWTAAMLVQGLLLALQVVGVLLLVGAVLGGYQGALWTPAALVLGCAVAAPALAAGCRAAARGPARAYGQEEERRLRHLSAGCGRTRVLEPVAAELMRYREVREQYVMAVGDTDRP